MSAIDIARFNADWLAAWSSKDVDRLAGFYAEDCLYKDPQTVEGLNGRAALRAYLEGLFAATPAMVYTPDTVWPIEGGFCGRWYCAIGEGGAGGRMRGFDLVLLKDGLIGVNEVYVHQMPAPAA
jgi:hypothetical protein